jgi:enoyl-CoA hydratase/carnithine racemase
MSDTAERDAPVTTSQRGRARWVSINREDRRNAMNKQVLADLEAAFTEAAADPAVRAIVLTGVGRRAFCAGADLSAGTGTFTLGLDEPTTDFGRLARLTRDLPIPVIARVNGACVAGGMALMAMCDLAIAADHAKFGLPEARVGVFPMQVLVYLRRLIAPRHVNALCLTGALIAAARAAEIGLINEIVPYDDLDARIDALVATLCEMSPVALKRGKYAINAMESMSFHEALPFAETLIAVTSLTADATEGLAAFNEKRKPAWQEPALKMNGDV